MMNVYDRMELREVSSKIEGFHEAVKMLVKQEPKTGHWIEHPTEKDYSVCSCCGIGCKRKEHGENADGTEYIDIYSYRFCPWCGARMVEAKGEQ